MDPTPTLLALKICGGPVKLMNESHNACVVFALTPATCELLNQYLGGDFIALWEEYKLKKPLHDAELLRIRKQNFERSRAGERWDYMEQPSFPLQKEPTLTLYLDKSTRFGDMENLLGEVCYPFPHISEQLCYIHKLFDKIIGTIELSNDILTVDVEIRTLEDHRRCLIKGEILERLWCYIWHRGRLTYLISHPPSQPSVEYEQEVAEFRALTSEALGLVHEDIALVETSDVFVNDGSDLPHENGDCRKRLADPESIRAWYGTYLTLRDSKAVHDAQMLRSNLDIDGIAAKLKNRLPLSSTQRKAIECGPQGFLRSLTATSEARDRLWKLLTEKERDVLRLHSWEEWRARLPTSESTSTSSLKENKQETHRKFFSVEVDPSSRYPAATITTVTLSSSFKEEKNYDRTFVVSSGEIVWGQFQCVLRGADLSVVM